MNKRVSVLVNDVQRLSLLNHFLPKEWSIPFVIQTDDRIVDKSEEIKNFLKNKTTHPLLIKHQFIN